MNKELYWGVILSYITTFVSLGISLLLTPIIIRLLGQSDYGLYESIGSFVNYLAVLDLGFGAVVTRYVAKYQIAGDIEGRDRFLYTCRNVYLVLCTIIFIIGIILYNCIDTVFGKSFNSEELLRAHQLFIIVLLTTIISIFSQVYKGVLIGIELFIWPRVIQLFKAVFSKIVSIIILYHGSNSVGFTSVMFAFEAIACALVIYKAHQHVHFRKNHMPFSQIKELFLFSSYLFILAIVAQVYWQIGKLVLGICVGTISVAIYSAALNITNILRNVSSSIKDVLIPRATHINLQSSDSSRRLTDFMIKSGRIIFIVYGLIMSGLTVLGQKFIYLWLGNDYLGAVPILILIGYSTILPTIILPGEELCKTYNKHGPLAFIYLFIALMNIILTFVMVKRMEMYGAAVATAISLFVGNVVLSLLYYKRVLAIQINRLFYGLFRRLIVVFISTIILGYYLNKVLYYQNWITLITESLIMAVFYFSLLFLYGFNAEERALASRLLFKIKK